jgi:hypothetical protein
MIAIKIKSPQIPNLMLKVGSFS